MKSIRIVMTDVERRQIEIKERNELENKRRKTPVRAIACHYSFDKSVLLIGCSQDTDSNEMKLEVESFEVLLQTSINKMATYLTDKKPTPTYKRGIYINRHFLEKAVKGCETFDLEKDENNDIPMIIDLFKSLKSEERLILPKDLNLSDIYVQKSLNLLLMAFAPRLVGKLNADGMPYGNPIPEDEGITGRIKLW